MRGKRYRKLLTWLLCICLIIGMIPSSAFPVSAESQDQAVSVTQENKENQKKEEQTTEQTTAKTEETSKSEETTKAEEKSTQEKKTEEKTTEEKATTTEEKKDEKNQVATQSSKDKKIATYDASSTAKVTAVQLTEQNNSVWGDGIQTGSSDLDSISWDKISDTNRGYDDSISNDIIRSFDTITYNVTSTINLKKGETHTLVFEVTLPKDDEITLDKAKMNAKEITSEDNGDDTVTYTCKFELADEYDGGKKQDNVVVKVGNKHQGYKIKPTIKAYLDEDKDAALTVENMKEVTVTTAPMYNIVLKKHTSESLTRDIYDFNNNAKNGEKYYSENASAYKDQKVNGYKCTYGFAVEIRKPGNGIKGVELPDSTKDFKFDIDLSEMTFKDKSGKISNLAEAGFNPLLYYSGPNEPGGLAVSEIPFTKEWSSYQGRGCYNSGDLTMTQDTTDKTKIHVTLKNFQIDANKFPDKNGKGESYWQDANKMLEGVFSAYRFQVVYPYVNENGDTIQSKLGDGTVNVAATVRNMDATSETGVNSKIETIRPDVANTDNTQTNSWELQSGSQRGQQIYYSDRTRNSINGFTDSYSVGKIRDDGDIAAVGADDVSFTVAYEDGHANDAYEKDDFPVAIDQFVLFDSSALKDIELNKNVQRGVNPGSATDGYTCTVRYAVLKDGKHLDNESMRTATLDDFDFYDSKDKIPAGKDVDGVMVQYRGMNLHTDKLQLYAQFNATVNKDYETVANKVYMVTAFTNVYTASEYKDELLNATGKTSLADVTRQDMSTWGKQQGSTVSDATTMVKDKNPQRIDNRSQYTVPEYVNGVYTIDKNHNFSQASADGLYIVPYTTTVTKTVAQTDEDGNPYQTYNIGKGQRYVDYRITSAMKYKADIQPVKGSKTTVYFEDTIPEGLTYIKGSAYWGGTYTSKYPSAGKVTGGEQVEPEVTTNTKGETVLKWAIKDVELRNGNLPELHYSCEISKDINDNKTLQNTVTIQTNEDRRPAYAENDNISTAAVKVTKSKEFYIVKRGGDSLELEDSSYYELVAANTSSMDEDNVCIFDTMPAAGDEKSTQFKGQYEITGLTMNAKDVDHADDMEVWYTDKTEYIGKTAKDIKPSEVTEANGWKKANASGYETDKITFTGDGLIGSWPTVIAYKDASLKKNTIATLRLEYKATAGAKSDDFVNSWTTMANNKELRSDAKTDIYKRSIEGTVWYDKDQDGKIGTDETKLKDVKVTLLVKDENGNYVPYTGYHETVDGKTTKSESVTYTDENGHYKFSGLPSGDYRVKFESSDKTDLGYYDVTKPNEGTDKTVTSKVEKKNAEKDNDGKLTSGTITDIEMPTLEQLINDKEKDYNLPDQNLGLIAPTTDIFVTKTWNDNDNQDGKRPSSIEVTLYKNSEATDKKLTITPAADGTWTGEFTNLPKYDDTDPQKLTPNTYTVKETSNVAGYTTGDPTGDATKGFVITNTHTPSTINIPVQKEWNDNNNQDGKRTTSVTVHLYANGTDTGKSLILTEAGNWEGTFEGLSEYSGGNKINYTVVEDGVNGYTTGVEKDDKGVYVITNSYTPETVNISGSKTWADSNNQDGARPDVITVNLLANGTKVDSQTVSEATGWNYSFTSKPKYENGTEIVYTVTEEAVEGYTTTYDGNNIKNSYTPGKTSVTVTKAWDDGNNQDNIRPDEVTVRLYANGDKTDKTITLKASENWSGSFTNLDLKKDGQTIKYTVKEDTEVNGYTSEITGDATTGYTVTNKHTPEVTEVSGSKIWNDNNNQDGIRPDKVTINLFKGVEKIASKEVTPDKDGNWNYKFENLAKYEAGNEIHYTVTEEAVEGYTSKVEGTNVINIHNPEVTEVSGSKTWDDKDNQDGKRPDKITIRLLANGDEVANKEVTEKDNWSYSFTNLPKNEDGKAIVYTITEDAVKDYATTINGYDVTNSYTPGKISVTVTKSWSDKNNKYKKRPGKVTVHLYADGVDTGKKLTLTKATNWSGSFTDLDQYKAGKVINYTIKEDKVTNYTDKITGDASMGYVVTNTYKPNKPGVPDDEGLKDKDQKNSSSNSSSSSSSSSSKSKTPTGTNKSAKTGDTNAVIPWMLVCVASLGAIFIVRRKL